MREKVRQTKNTGNQTKTDQRTRIGEAETPGPQVHHKVRFEHEGAQLQIINMPDDGQCLYHAIGYHLGSRAKDIRDTLLREVEKWWKQIMPWDTAEELRQFKAQTADEKQWGNAQHIALRCKI